MEQFAEDQVAEFSRTFGDELPPGTALCHGQYTVEKYLNSGGFGVTYLALDSLGRRVVIKECFPNAMCCRFDDIVRVRSRSLVQDFERVVELFEKEARALAHLQHPNVVGVHQIFKDNGTAYMALDYVEALDLLEVHETQSEILTPDTIKSICIKLLEALTYVHSNGILHRDISPDNILLDRDRMPVLIDFGAARESASRASRVLSRVHTVKDGYSPQEFYLAGSAQSPASDLFALAATFHHLITGAPPPNSNTRLVAIAENRPDTYEPLKGRFPAYEPAFLGAIDTCLNLFSKDRLESAEAWLDVIAGRERRVPAAAQAKEDARFAQRIKNLVTETCKAIEADRARKKEKEEVAAIEPEEDPKLKAEREYWAILNEDYEDPKPNKKKKRAKPVRPVAKHANSRVTTRLNTPTEEGDAPARSLFSSLMPWSGQDRSDAQSSNP